MSLVFQDNNLFAHLDIASNIGLGIDPSLRLSAQDRAAVSTALERVGLAPRADVVAGSLAHGEKRALELALGLVQEPRLLLLDEPMAGTGREETERLTELLASLEGRVAMLIVEHDMATVFRLAHRITVLIGGAVAISGSPEAIRADATVRSAYLGEEAP